MYLSRNSHVSVCLLSLLCLSYASCCFGFGTFGFDIHHRYSDSVKKILDVDDLPEKGSFQYYSDLAGRDRLLHGRRLATENDQTPVTFLYGNDTHQLSSFGHLHYANVTVGTPGLSFLVALDTGSDLFWLPCDCTRCVRSVNTSSGVVNFNIFSPKTSSTSSKVPCNSTLCELQNRCSSPSSNCPYEVRYLDKSTSTGYLVEDVLHLITNDNKSKAVDAPISFGCGKVQTGLFLDGGALNGLFGLGVDKTSVPSILAKQGVTSNSFSMCFGPDPDGIGRIVFGDKGSSDQGETPFYLRQSFPTYNITVTQTSVGGNAVNLEFSAIFDTGTTFTQLKDPSYTQISETFNSLAKQQRYQNSSLPFEYCYLLSSNQTSFEYPSVNLTMKGGHQFFVNDPTVESLSEENSNLYCLAIVKSDKENIIGQNFMTGYNIVFDREKNVLGWKPSDCYGTDK